MVNTLLVGRMGCILMCGGGGGGVSGVVNTLLVGRMGCNDI